MWVYFSAVTKKNYNKRPITQQNVFMKNVLIANVACIQINIVCIQLCNPKYRCGEAYSTVFRVCILVCVCMCVCGGEGHRDE